MIRTISRKRLCTLATIPLLACLLCSCSPSAPATDTASGSASTSLPSIGISAFRADSHFLLKADATSPTLVLFTDFQCPYCARIDPLIMQAKEEYAGRINLVVRNFPLSMHKNAVPSAQAVEAAAAQGKFVEMMGLIFAGQKSWAEAVNPSPIFDEYARTLGLNLEQFAADYSSERVRARINQDNSAAISLGLRGTPSLVLDGIPLRVDSSNYGTIKGPLDTALAR